MNILVVWDSGIYYGGNIGKERERYTDATVAWYKIIHTEKKKGDLNPFVSFQRMLEKGNGTNGLIVTKWENDNWIEFIFLNNLSSCAIDTSFNSTLYFKYTL